MIRLLVRSIVRTPKRSLPIVLTSFFCTFLLQIGIAWIDGIHESITQTTILLHGKQRIIANDFQKRESLYPISSHISPISFFDTLPHVPKLGFLAEVQHQEKSKRAPILGFPTSYIQEKILPTGTLDGHSLNKERSILIGKNLAEELAIAPSDSIILMTQTQDMSPSAEKFIVSGILHTKNTFLDRAAYISLIDAQWMTDIEDGATELVLLHDNIDVSKTLSSFQNKYGFSLIVSSWEEKEPYASVRNITNLINSAMLFFITLCSWITLFNVSWLHVQRTLQEIGILRALGASKKHILFTQIVGSLSLLFFGITIGIFGAYTFLYISQYSFPLGESLSETSTNLPMAEQIYPHINTKRSIFIGVFLLGTGLMGALLPYLSLRKKDPIEIITRLS